MGRVSKVVISLRLLQQEIFLSLVRCKKPLWMHCMHLAKQRTVQYTMRVVSLILQVQFRRCPRRLFPVNAQPGVEVERIEVSNLSTN